MLGRHMAFRPTPQCNSSRVSNTLDAGVHKSKRIELYDDRRRSTRTDTDVELDK